MKDEDEVSISFGFKARSRPTTMMSEMKSKTNSTGEGGRKSQMVDDIVPTPMPEKWDRCHAYNERKKRYCRQMPLPLSGQCGDTIQPRYCGNHRHLMDEWLSNNGYNPTISNDGHKAKRQRANTQTESEEDSGRNRNKKDRGKRVPCPIDPSHLIFESAISKHVLICPAVKKKQKVTGKDYYREGINLGGFGGKGSDDLSEGRNGNPIVGLEESKELAYAVLRVFNYLFLSPSNGNEFNIGARDMKGNHCTLSNKQLQNISEREIYNALPEVDLSEVEEQGKFNATLCQPCAQDGEREENQVEEGTQSNTGRLTHSIAKHRIRAGGPRHLHQIASILGHVRQNGLISTNKSESDNSPLIVEMGAGRGMTGLIVAGATGASLNHVNNPTAKVKLCLVERSGTRGKAENKIRAAEGSTTQSKDDCLRLDLVEVTRVKCDLAHVDMSKALPSEMRSNSSQTVVIAKHLCGAGTDLALKSLTNIGAIDGCVMATCCHGLCTWNEYVGRDCFLSLLCGEIGGLNSFGEKEFNLLKRWTSASVLEDGHNSEAGTTVDDNKMKEEQHYAGSPGEKKGRCPNIFAVNILAVVNEARLACGSKGLGRACQRLIDYGRCEYMKNNLFRSNGSSSNDGGFNVSLLHYVPRDVTPQNALIVASKSRSFVSPSGSQ